MMEKNVHQTAAFEKGNCPNCGLSGMSLFYEIKGAPVHSVLLLKTREEALSINKGDISLGYCSNCSFIANVDFNPDLHSYSQDYEETQGFSPTFNKFHKRLAEYLIDRYHLYDKDIIEIGCGKGEFLKLLCETGNNRGIGFDPAFRGDRYAHQIEDVTFITDFYSEKYAHHQGDFICCKMTLEHIQHTAAFIKTVQRSIGNNPNVTVFFQIPDVTRILKEKVFWDIYYEHCSYFSPYALGYLFVNNGFEITDLWVDFGDQYLMIEAHPLGVPGTKILNEQENPVQIEQQVVQFGQKCELKINEWKHKLADLSKRGKQIVLWGSGSKAVSFLAVMEVSDIIDYVVDINPYRQGTYMAGTGQEIVDKEHLIEYRPDVVIIMNPIYLNEITKDLNELGLNPEILVLE